MKTIFTQFRIVFFMLITGLFTINCGGGGGGGAPAGGDGGTNLSKDASLSGLSLSHGSLDQLIQADLFEYTATVSFLISSVTVSAVTSHNKASLNLNGDQLDTSTGQLKLELIEGENNITVEVTAEDGSTRNTYIIVVTRQSKAEFIQQAYLKASNPDKFDDFGFRVALSGDTLVVGAYREDGDTNSDGIEEGANNDANHAGVVYVFERTDGNWVQQAYLKGSNTEGGLVFGDRFGWSIDVDEDTLVVGAAYEDGSASSDGMFNEMLVDNDDEPNAGAVYVFVRNSGVWTQQAYLKAINAEAGDLFGWSVGIAGDTVMIGAVGESGTKSSDGKLSSDKDDDGATGAGAVYVFSRKGTEWKQIEYLKAENAGELDRFGYDVDIEANTLVVSAVGEKGDANSKVGAYNDNEGKDTGAVYVFTLAEGVWDQTHYLKAKDAKTKDAFGQSVAINDDTLVVGAPGKDGRKGAAYIFNRDDSNWLYSVTLSASNAEAGDLFGYSVDIDGNSLVISAVSEGGDVNSTIEASNNDAPESGAAYLYVRSGDVWEQQVYVKASNPDDKDFFGFSVGISGDTLVVGANGEASADGVQSDNNAAGAGAVYVFQ